LERACPLKELLPASTLAEEQGYSADLGDPQLDTAALSSILWAGSGGQNHLHSGQVAGGTGSAVGGYASSCFSLLREVYDKLYGTQQSIRTHTVVPGTEPDMAAPLEEQSQQQQQQQQEPGRQATASPARLMTASRSGGYHRFLLPNGRPREYNLKYMLSQTQQRQQMKQRRPAGRATDSPDRAESDTDTGAGSGTDREGRGRRVSGAKLSMAAATAGSAYREKSAAAAASSPSLSDSHDHSPDTQETELGHRRRDHSLLLDSEGGAELYSLDVDPDAAPFDADRHISDLRAPFLHLRSEQSGGGRGPSALSGHSSEEQDKGQDAGSSDAGAGSSDKTLPGPSASSGRRGAGLGLSSPSPSAQQPNEPNLPFTAQARAQTQEQAQGQGQGQGGAGVRGFEGSALNSISGEEITLPGVSTAIIADDLELLVRKFVRAPRRARRALAQQAAKYFDELDINFPNVRRCFDVQ
jgi:hypothetical protein